MKHSIDVRNTNTFPFSKCGIGDFFCHFIIQFDALVHAKMFTCKLLVILENSLPLPITASQHSLPLITSQIRTDVIILHDTILLTMRLVFAS